MFKPCIVIPVYKHVEALSSFADVFSYVPVIIVDDGNDDKQVLQEIAAKYNASLLPGDTNEGKGAAVLRGFKEALRLGFTHVLQVDADNQHNTNAIKTFLAEAEANPEMLINSYPVYDSSAHAIRQHGRKVTNFWVSLETRTDEIKDAMCGFRVYPLKQMEPLFDKVRFKRMGFDIEIIVKAYWQGIDIINLPVDVRYPDGGHSNYKLIIDNAKISCLHAYLFCLSFFANKHTRRDKKEKQ